MKQKICPKCGSKNVEYKPEPWQASAGAQSDYKCNDCGFEGTLFPEVNE